LDPKEAVVELVGGECDWARAGRWHMKPDYHNFTTTVTNAASPEVTWLRTSYSSCSVIFTRVIVIVGDTPDGTAVKQPQHVGSAKQRLPTHVYEDAGSAGDAAQGSAGFLLYGRGKYSGASVYELNPFLEAVRKPKCS
jgi:hypothetical protein